MKKARLFLFISLLLLAFLSLHGSAAAQTGTVISVAPSLTEVDPGEQFTVEVWVKDVVDLYGFDVTLNYEAADLTFVSVEFGDLLFPDMPVRCEETEIGVVQCAASQQTPHEPTSEDGVLFRITFNAKMDEVYTYLTIDEDSVLTDFPGVVDLPYTSERGAVQIGDAEPPAEESYIYIPLFIR